MGLIIDQPQPMTERLYLERSFLRCEVVEQLAVLQGSGN